MSADTNNRAAWRYVTETGPANLLHASAYYSECNKWFGLFVLF